MVQKSNQRPTDSTSHGLDYDVIVVGGGPGGYVTAIRAAQLGFRTAVVEREHLGGVCLNWGCIPTKTLLRSAEIYEYMQHARSFGLRAENISFDLKDMVTRSRKVAEKLSGGVKYLLKKNRVTVIEGHGRLVGEQRLTVEKESGQPETLSAQHIVLATGARPCAIPGMEPDGRLIWDYKHAMIPDSLPDSLLVIGAGAIGIEFASFYNALGVEVTIVEMMSQVLPAEDGEIAQLASESFRKQGIDIHLNSRVTKLEKSGGGVVATLDIDGKPTEKKFDQVISAVGVVGNHEDLGLENTAATIEDTFVVTNEWSQTGEPGLYAIGDLAGPPCLAHKASHEGVVCIERIAGLPHVQPLDRRAIPRCTYSRPQVASVGLTEAESRRAGYEVNVGRFPYRGNGKAMALGEVEGLVKTVFDAGTGQLLGAHMIGVEVTELIQGFGIAQKLETTELELMHTVFPHPTLSEMMHEATLDAFGQAIHI